MHDGIVQIAMKTWLKIRDLSAVAEARRRSRHAANAVGLPSTTVEHVAIVATEIAQNILRHSTGGSMLAEAFGAPGAEHLYLLGTDEGPGIHRIDRMLKDGATTKSSPGTGLGAIHRLSDRLDIDTGPGGTALVAEFWQKAVRLKDPPNHGGFSVVHPGQRVCGDAIAARNGEKEDLYFLCDGLGHGPKAAHAAEAARAAFLAAKSADPGELLQGIDAEIGNTRGAVGAVIAINRELRKLRYAAIGNISTLIAEGKSVRRLPTRDGLLGPRRASPYVEEVDLEEDAVIVMHSDGLSTIRDLETRTALLRRSAPVIAARLLFDRWRARDDASIIVAALGEARSI